MLCCSLTHIIFNSCIHDSIPMSLQAVIVRALFTIYVVCKYLKYYLDWLAYVECLRPLFIVIRLVMLGWSV